MPTAHRHPASLFLLLILLPLLGLLLPAPARAQGVTLSTTTEVEFGGTLGLMASMMAGVGDPVTETVYLQGGRSRTDSGSSSTIVDAPAGRFTVLDHETGTYHTYTLADLMAEMDAAVAEAKAAQAEALEEEGVAPRDPDEPAPSYRLDISMERTGETMDMGGYSAERLLMIVEVIPENPQEGGEADVAHPESLGAMVSLYDFWYSREVPGYEAYRAIQEEMAREMAGEMVATDFGADLAQAFAYDPRIQEAMAGAAREMEDLDGIPVKTTMSMVLVPMGMALDREAVYATYGQRLSQDMGSLVASAAADVAADVAEDAARQAVSNLTKGLLGRKKRREPEAAPPPEPRQVVLLRVTSTVDSLEEGDLPPDLFLPPPDYREVDSPMAGGGGGR